MMTVLLATCLSCACAGEKTGDDPAAIAEWLAATPQAQVLDVRTPEEFATGHIPTARLIPINDERFDERVKTELDPGKPVLANCRSGRRSAMAEERLGKLGFSNVRHLDGGILEWDKAGQPIVKPAPAPPAGP